MVRALDKSGFAAAWGALFLTLCFVRSEWFTDPGLFPKFLVWAVIMGGVALAISKRPVPAPGAVFRHNIPLLCFAIYLVAAIPSLVISQNLADGLFSWLREVQVLLFALLVIAWFDNDLRLIRGFGIFMTITLFVLAQWGVLEWVLNLDGTVLTHKGTYGVKTSFGHRNLYAQFLMLGLAFVLPVALQRTRWAVVAWITVFLVVSLGILLLSRGAWLMLAVYAVLLVSAWAVFRLKVHVSSKAWTIAGAALLFALVVMAFTIDQWYTIWHHFETALTTGAGTTRDRLLLFTRSWELFSEQPWTGVGAGMWKVEIMKFSQEGMLTESAALYYQRPHNDYAWVFSESGLLAGTAFAASHVSGLFIAVHRFVRERDLWTLAVALAWVAYMLVSFTNFPRERMEFSLVFAFLLAFGARPVTLPHMPVRWFSPVMTVAALVLVTLYGLRLRSEYHFVNALKARENGAWDEYLAGVQKARGPFMKFDDASLPLAWHEGLGLFNTGKQTQGCATFKEALEANPYHPEVWNDLGVCASEQGNAALALAHFQKAVENTPTYQRAWLNIAAMQYTSGDWRGAFNSFVQADPYTPNELYDRLGTRLGTDSLNVLVDVFPERRLRLTVEAFRNTPHWALSLVRKCAMNKMEFKKQVLIDACYYMLKNCDGGEDCAEAQAIREKYIPGEVLHLDG